MSGGSLPALKSVAVSVAQGHGAVLLTGGLIWVIVG